MDALKGTNRPETPNIPRVTETAEPLVPVKVLEQLNGLSAAVTSLTIQVGQLSADVARLKEAARGHLWHIG